MKDKVGLFYNPVAGGGRFRYRLDQVIGILQEYDLQVVPFRIKGNEQLPGLLRRIDPEDYHALVAAGGDGTVSGLAGAVMESSLDIPLGIIPVGTTNDVANFLAIPRNIKGYCRTIAEGRPQRIDLGTVNGRFFINVASAGAIPETAHEVDYQVKNALGRLAYYLKAVEKLPGIRPLQLRLDVDGVSREMEVLLFMILNGGTVGGFPGLLPPGCMSDGKLDFIAVKPAPLPKLARLLVNYRRGELLEDENILHFDGSGMFLEVFPPAGTDLDGEKGPDLPWEVKVQPGALSFRVL